MADTLLEELRRQIRQGGPMGIGEYMMQCLSHPQHGYYMKKDPFGRAGDFVTAPEVSQMFGEMIGVWAADIWRQMGAPEAFILLECGPGRGSLMADILRATRHVEGFHDAVRVHLLEISPVLKEMQGAALDGHSVCWHEALGDVPDDMPVIVIGNEFLDALPFKSLQKGGDGWGERAVALDDAEALCFALRPLPKALQAHIPFVIQSAAAGSVSEISPARQGFVVDVAARLRAQGGAALFVDYGHVRSAVGDTFQGLKDNAYADVLSAPGDVDLTSHVDFEALVQDVPEGVTVHGPITQGAFLKGLGIEARAAALRAAGDDGQGADVQRALHRLVAPSQMGELFKVIVLSV